MPVLSSPGIAALVLGGEGLMIDLPRPAGPHQAVVCLPTEIDITNSHRIRERLAAAALSGATTVVADMTRTTVCDCEGAYSLAQAHRQLAASNNVELRLAVPSAEVRAVVAGLALDGLVNMYPSLDAALSPGPVPPEPLAMSPAGPSTTEE